MSEPFLGEIRAFSFNFAPKGWAWCDGQLLPIAQNTGLFALLGINYGGDGKSTFALPDLQGRVPMHPGWGPGLSEYAVGESLGAETVTLTQAQMPAHAHLVASSNATATTRVPSAGRVLAQPPAPAAVHAPPGTVVWPSSDTIHPTGGDQPHNNMQPYLTFYYAIALQGVFPQRP
ncbi:phage tail protein [Nocardioides sp. SR21]|uniref:phage tail protein n=1 Tax=Nocardioides sp. SR21 TaxID=2919501 RepID=UPI001FAA0FB9|nr:tail fiber protein [Nocardioides sp. SR21]